MSVERAYDAIALEYDRLSWEDEAVRQRLWQIYLNCFQPGQHLLDVACGTGIDSIFLAKQGFRITAVDVSPGMIEQLRHKVQREITADPIQTHVLDIAYLDALLPTQFDGLISAFAGLNTASDLSAFAATAHHLLRPNGRMVLHMLNGFSLWEWMGLLFRGKWQQAQALSQQSERWVKIGGVPVCHHLYTIDDAYERFFVDYFLLQQRFGMGIWRPPGNGRSALARFLDKVEDHVGEVEPWRGWGRFFVLVLQKRS